MTESVGLGHKPLNPREEVFVNVQLQLQDKQHHMARLYGGIIRKVTCTYNDREHVVA